eukprot:sb/3462339/
MAMQFEYDETGSTFYYFMLAFFLIVFLPLTYLIWPFKSDPRSKRRTVPCTCRLCLHKSHVLREKRKNTPVKVIKFLVLAVGWTLIVFFAYKAATTENTHVEYNPFVILGIDPEATQKEIKKAYKKLSLVHHPDKGGDEQIFVNINKAYQALTDEVTRQNWIDHGNPDGPQATQFGIALPSWIVDKDNSVFVLGVYVAIFMILLPVVVGSWWYKSIKYSADDILLRTTQMLFGILARNSLHNVKKLIMVLCSAFEFEESNNKEIKARKSDNFQLPLLMKECKQLAEKTPVYPFRYLYSIKARTLLHSYCNRSPSLNEDNWLDIGVIAKKMPALINEAINVCFQLIIISKRQKNVATPNLQTFENLMRINVMAVQAMWSNQHPLFQLPHFTEDMLKYFMTKRNNVKTLLAFAQLTEKERKSRLRMLSEEEYDNMMRVLWSMPYIDMQVKSQVLDDENTMTISASSIVTVTCYLERKYLRDVVDEVEVEQEAPAATKEQEEEKEKKKTWQKQPKKQKTIAKKKKPVPKKKTKSEDNKENEQEFDQKDEGEDGDDEDEPEEDQGDEDAPPSENEEEEDQDQSDAGSDQSDEEGQYDEEKEWRALQEETGNKKTLSTEQAESHPVHCPYFPVDKEEGWWVFIADRKTGEVITQPKYVAGLKDELEVILKFQAPDTVGHHKYNVILKSDCYIACEKEVLLKMFVEKEMKTKGMKQWENISESEESDSMTESDITNSEDDDDDGSTILIIVLERLDHARAKIARHPKFR